MTADPKAGPKNVPILNPQYTGATPEDVGRALLRHSELAPKHKAEGDEDQEADAA